MKIGFFTDRYYPQVDGVAVSVDLFAKELRKLGHEVYIFCPQGPKRIAHEPAHIVRFRSFPSIWYEDYRDTMPFTPAIIRKVRSHKLDVIHIHTPAQIGMLGVRIGRLDNIPLVATHHTDIEQYIKVYRRLMAGVLAGILFAPALMKSTDSYRSAFSSLKPRRSIKTWNRQVIQESLNVFYSNFKIVFAPSQKMLALLQSYQTPSRLEVLPTGIDPDEMKLTTSFDPRKHYDIGASDPILLFVGRLGQEKNIQLIIKSLPAVLKHTPQAKLLIVGDGPYREELEELAQDTGVEQNIIFTGMLDRAKTFACFRASTVFVFPSLTDTQGLVLNEACYFAKPVVYCDPDISPLTINHQTGLLARPTASDLAKKAIELIDNPARAIQYGLNAHEKAQTITIHKQATKLIEFYQQVV